MNCTVNLKELLVTVKLAIRGGAAASMAYPGGYSYFHLTDDDPLTRRNFVILEDILTAVVQGNWQNRTGLAVLHYHHEDFFIVARPAFWTSVQQHYIRRGYYPFRVTLAEDLKK